jgi:hypothetical protein
MPIAYNMKIQGFERLVIWNIFCLSNVYGLPWFD